MSPTWDEAASKYGFGSGSAKRGGSQQRRIASKVGMEKGNYVARIALVKFTEKPQYNKDDGPEIAIMWSIVGRVHSDTIMWQNIQALAPRKKVYSKRLGKEFDIDSGMEQLGDLFVALGIQMLPKEVSREAVMQELEQAVKDKTQVFGYWNDRNNWTPERPVEVGDIQQPGRADRKDPRDADADDNSIPF